MFKIKTFGKKGNLANPQHASVCSASYFSEKTNILTQSLNEYFVIY